MLDRTITVEHMTTQTAITSAFPSFASNHLTANEGALCIYQGANGVAFSSFNWTTTSSILTEILRFLDKTPDVQIRDTNEDSSENLDGTDPDNFFSLEEDYLAQIEEKIEQDAPDVEETIKFLSSRLDSRDQETALTAVSSENEVDVVPQTSQLLSHSELQKWGLTFNRAYGIFVCTTCQGGLAIDQLHRHLIMESSQSMRPNLDDKAKTPYKEVSIEHGPRASTPSSKVLQAEIKATLELMGVSEELATAAEINNQWKASTHTNPVEGLYTFSAQRCPAPGCGIVVVGSVYEHNKLHKPKPSPPLKYEQVQAQSLLLPKDFRYYRQVSGPMRIIPQTEPSSITLKALQTQVLPSADVEAVQGLRKDDLHRFTITVAHHDLGVPEFHAQFGEENLPALLHPPKEWNDTMIERLRLAQQATSKADIEAFHKSPGTLRQQILAHTRSQAKNPAFTIPRKPENYFPMQRQLVYLLINVNRLNKFHVLPMSDNLKASIETLVQTLKQRNKDLKVQDAFRAVLNAVYFPPQLQWSSERGLGTAPEVLLAIKSKLQFFIRLRAIAKLQPHFEQSLVKDAYDFSSTFCEQYLNEMCPSAYSGVRQWIHEFTSVVLRTTRPYTVQWTDEKHENLILEGHSISKKDYCRGILERMQKLEDFVREKVLFNIDVGDVRSQLDTLAQAAAENPGLPVLLANSVAGHNPQSDAFATQVLALGHLALSANGDLDHVKTKVWVKDVRDAFCSLHSMVHTTQGLPGRGAEDHVLELRDMVYQPLQHALAITPVVLKTPHSKDVIRLLPEAVSRLLYILIRIVRPLECVALLRFNLVTDSHKLLQLYDSQVWAIGGQGMDSRLLSKNLATWLHATPGTIGFDFDMGLKLYRHFAVALDRDLGGLKRDASHNIGDYQAGRTPNTSHRHYAVHKGLENSELRKLQIQKSLDWHRMLGFDISESE
ncbi:hypothetical protein B0H14DRAFT_3689205, partial [Mycena olivaceomarginata]